MDFATEVTKCVSENFCALCAFVAWLHDHDLDSLADIAARTSTNSATETRRYLERGSDEG